MFQPSWVTEQCLNWNIFECCGDEDLHPFKCVDCGYLLVLCYECETLYCDLTDLSCRRAVNFDNYICPKCNAQFGDIFRAKCHRSIFEDWNAAGVVHLITIPEESEFVKMLSGSSTQLADFLSRGMRSTVKGRLTGYRNLAESLIDQFPGALELRQQGFSIASSNTFEDSLKWFKQLSDSATKPFGLLGIVDSLFPE